MPYLPSPAPRRFPGFKVFRRDVEPDCLVAVALDQPLPIVLTTGWRLCFEIPCAADAPDNMDIEAAEVAISRDGYYVFDAFGRTYQSHRTR